MRSVLKGKLVEEAESILVEDGTDQIHFMVLWL